MIPKACKQKCLVGRQFYVFTRAAMVAFSAANGRRPPNARRIASIDRLKVLLFLSDQPHG